VTPKGRISVRSATLQDQSVLAALLLEATHHYWGDRPGAATDAEATAKALLDGTSGCQAVIAEHQEKGCLGFATYTLLHPAPVSEGTIFLKDLFVSASARSFGVGAVVMHWLAALAVEKGCARLDWTAETDNPRAIAFYDQIGATRVKEKLYFRFDGAELKDFAAQGEQMTG